MTTTTCGRRGDTAAAIPAAVRRLAFESHQVLNRHPAGGPPERSETIGGLLSRIDDLLRRLDQGRAHGLRLWLGNLRRQVLISQELGEILGHAGPHERRDDGPPIGLVSRRVIGGSHAGRGADASESARLDRLGRLSRSETVGSADSERTKRPRFAIEILENGQSLGNASRLVVPPARWEGGKLIAEAGPMLVVDPGVAQLFEGCSVADEMTQSNLCRELGPDYRVAELTEADAPSP